MLFSMCASIKLVYKLCFYINISVTAEASEVKFGMLLAFAKAHHKITLPDKSGRGHVLRSSPKCFGSLSYFSNV